MSGARRDFLRVGGTISPGKHLAIGLSLTLIKSGLDFFMAT